MLQLFESCHNTYQWTFRINVIHLRVSQLAILTLHQLLQPSEVQPNNPMNVASPTLLELYFVAPVLDTHGVAFGCDDLADHCLDPVLKITGCCHNITSYQRMMGLLDLLINELVDGLPLTVGRSGFSNYLGLTIHHLNPHVDAVASLQQECSKICIPPEISTAQRKKDLESPQVFHLGQNLIPLTCPIFGGHGDALQAAPGIRQAEGQFATI